MNHNRKNACIAIALVLVALATTLAAFATPASAAAPDPNGDRSVAENITSMKTGIINTLATWVPFLVLFALLGLALNSIGIGGVFKHH